MQGSGLLAATPLYGAPYGIVALLLGPNPAAAAPVEGPWIPVAALGAKNACIELFGSGTVGVDLYETNNPNAQNGYTVTVGGSVTTSDPVSLNIINPNLPGGKETVTYTTIGGDTTTTIATALAAAVNADPVLQEQGISATSASAVVTVNFPSVAPESNPGGSSWSQSAFNYTTVTGTVGGSATETLTAACLTTGVKIGSSLSAFGMTALTVFPGYVKARLTALSGTGASAQAALAASV